MDTYTIRIDNRKLISKPKTTFEVVSKVGTFEQNETDEMLVMKRIRMIHAVDLVKEISIKGYDLREIGNA